MGKRFDGNCAVDYSDLLSKTNRLTIITLQDLSIVCATTVSDISLWGKVHERSMTAINYRESLANSNGFSLRFPVRIEPEIDYALPMLGG